MTDTTFLVSIGAPALLFFSGYYVILYRRARRAGVEADRLRSMLVVGVVTCVMIAVAFGIPLIIAQAKK